MIPIVTPRYNLLDNTDTGNTCQNCRGTGLVKFGNDDDTGLSTPITICSFCNGSGISGE